MDQKTMLVIALALVIGVCSIYFMGADNVVEEISEEIIKAKTGQDIDLSPNSPEQSKK